MHFGEPPEVPKPYLILKYMTLLWIKDLNSHLILNDNATKSKTILESNPIQAVPVNPIIR